MWMTHINTSMLRQEEPPHNDSEGTIAIVKTPCIDVKAKTMKGLFNGLWQLKRQLDLTLDGPVQRPAAVEEAVGFDVGWAGRTPTVNGIAQSAIERYDLAD
jgi:hypothetical protein